jgi:hypothetical protein
VQETTLIWPPWSRPGLPDVLKAGIVAMVKAASFMGDEMKP